MADIRPYTAIPDYFERSPQDLSAPGGFMAYSERVTSFARQATGLAMSHLFIFPEDIERFREAGTVLVAPTHRSFLDLTAVSMLAEATGEGQPFFMSKRGNMDSRLTAWFYSKMRTFPIENRKEHLKEQPEWGPLFMKWARFTLGSDLDRGEQDRKLVLFPEGTRKEGDVVYDIEEGTLIAARRNKVPILPIGIYSSHYGLLSSVTRGLPSLFMTVGEPFKPTKRTLSVYLEHKMQEQYDKAKASLEEVLAA